PIGGLLKETRLAIEDRSGEAEIPVRQREQFGGGMLTGRISVGYGDTGGLVLFVELIDETVVGQVGRGETGRGDQDSAVMKRAGQLTAGLGEETEGALGALGVGDVRDDRDGSAALHHGSG